MDNGLTRVSIHRVHTLPPRHCGQVVGIAMAEPPTDDDSSWAAAVAASAGPSAHNRMLRAVPCLPSRLVSWASAPDIGAMTDPTHWCKHLARAALWKDGLDPAAPCAQFADLGCEIHVPLQRHSRPAAEG